MASMEYRASESSYVGQASNGTMVRVDESEFAESVRDAVKSEGLDYDSPTYNERYAYWRDQHLNADEWVHLIGDNPGVTDVQAENAERQVLREQDEAQAHNLTGGMTLEEEDAWLATRESEDDGQAQRVVLVVTNHIFSDERGFDVQASMTRFADILENQVERQLGGRILNLEIRTHVGEVLHSTEIEPGPHMDREQEEQLQRDLDTIGEHVLDGTYGDWAVEEGSVNA